MFVACHDPNSMTWWVAFCPPLPRLADIRTGFISAVGSVSLMIIILNQQPRNTALLTTTSLGDFFIRQLMVSHYIEDLSLLVTLIHSQKLNH